MSTPHRARGLSASLLALLLSAITTGSPAYEPQVNYMLHCMGCHTPDGSGEPGRVPSVRETLLPRASTEAGRKFLVQVPGSAQSRLSNAELAEVLNWMIRNLTPESQRHPFKPYTAAEVARLRPRHHPAR